jgi:hypothetical protein
MNVCGRFPEAIIQAIPILIKPTMDQAVQELAGDANPLKPHRVVEYQRILDRQDAGAMLTGASEHWHGLREIHASRTGTPFSVGKPPFYTIDKGRAMVEVSKKRGGVAVLGTPTPRAVLLPSSRDL